MTRALLTPRAQKLAAPLPAALYDGRLDAARRSLCAPLSGHSLTCSGPRHSLPRRQDGRVVKGVNFVNLRDASDQSRPSIAYDEAGADGSPSSTSPRATEPRHRSTWCGARRKPGSCRSRSAAACAPSRDIRALLTSGADKVTDQYRRGLAALSSRKRRKNSAIQCIVVAIDARSVAAGRSRTAGRFSPMAAAIRPAHRRRRLCPRGRSRRRRRRLLLTSMDRVGTRQGFDIALTRAIDAGHRASHRLGRRPAISITWSGIRGGHASRRAGGIDLPRRRIFPCARPGPYGAGPACRCGSRP